MSSLPCLRLVSWLIVPGLLLFASSCVPVRWYAELDKNQKTRVRQMLTRQGRFPQKTQLVANIVRVRRDGDNALQVERIHVLASGQERKGIFPVYCRENTVVRAYVTDKDLDNQKQLANLEKDLLDGNWVVPIPLENLPENHLLIIRQKDIRQVASFLYFFQPGFFGSTLYAELDIDLGSSLFFLSSQARMAMDQNMTIDKTRYRWQYWYTANPELGAEASEEKLPGVVVSDFALDNHEIQRFLAREFRNFRKNDILWHKKAESLLKGLSRDREKAFYLYETLLADHLSLEPGLVTSGTGAGHSQADFALQFASLLLHAGQDVRIVIPVLEQFDDPLIPSGSVGVCVSRAGQQDLWFFPRSRLSAPGSIPDSIRGKRCLFIEPSGAVSTGRIAGSGEKNALKLWMTAYLNREGGGKFSVRSTLQGDPAYHARERLNASSLILGRARLLALYGLGLDRINLSAFEVSHSHVLRHPLKIVVRGKSRFFGKREKKRWYLQLSRFRRFQQPLTELLQRGVYLDKIGIPAYACSYYEYIRFYLPSGMRIVSFPASFRYSNRLLRYVKSVRFVRGGRIKKPEAWSLERWQNWLKNNSPYRRSSVIMERSLELKNWKAPVRDREAVLQGLQGLEEKDSQELVLEI